MTQKTKKPPEFAYQQYAREKILERGKTAVIAPPGAGKTRPVIEAVTELTNTSDPILVICSGPAIATWKWQLPYWGDIDPSEIHIVSGTAADRKLVLSTTKDGGYFIMNAAVFRIDFDQILKIKWAAVIADEYHKFMLRRKSKTYLCYKKLTRHMKLAVQTTGSVVRRDPSSMFTAFSIMDPMLRTFRSYWRFVNTFCLVEDGYYGKQIVGVKNVKRLKSLMDHYMAYIPEEVVADQLPKGRRMRLEAEMTQEQESIYESLVDDMLAILDAGDIVIAGTALDLRIKLRKLLCCPRILGANLGMGGGFEAICDELEDDPHAAIFVPFRDAVTELTKELRKRGYKVHSLMGGASAEEVLNVITRVKRERGVLVCTIPFAESFDLETCSKSYFLGYDYSLDQNKQAEGRTRRAISKHKFVTWKYVCLLDTIDEELLEKLIVDHANVQQVLDRPKEFIRLLKGQ